MNVIADFEPVEIVVTYTRAHPDKTRSRHRITIQAKGFSLDLETKRGLPEFGAGIPRYKLSDASFKIEGDILEVKEETLPAPYGQYDPESGAYLPRPIPDFIGFDLGDPSKVVVQNPPKNGKSELLSGDWTAEQRELIMNWLNEEKKKKKNVVDPTRHYTKEEIEAMET